LGFEKNEQKNMEEDMDLHPLHKNGRHHPLHQSQDHKSSDLKNFK